MKRLVARHGVIRVIGDQCMYGFKSRDEMGAGFALRRTGSSTNPACIAMRLSNLCPNGRGDQVHRRAVLEGGRTRAAHAYPFTLCREICNGIPEQVVAGRKGQFMFVQVNMRVVVDSWELHREPNRTTVQ